MDLMLTAIRTIIARFPERSLVIRSGSDTRYLVLKTWHQLSVIGAAALIFIWLAVASIGFSWNYVARLAVESELAMTVAENQAFIAQLETDQKNAYELRQAYNAEIRRNEEWASRFNAIRNASNVVLEQTPPETIIAFIPWFQGQLDTRIREVEQSNADLTQLVLSMSDSVAEISGRQAPESLDAVGSWLGNVSADLANAYETQTEAMELLHDIMTQNLSKGFATIDGTPLSDPEFAGFSPSFGMGGPDRGAGQGKHVFERFEERSQRLMALSQDLQALHALLSCAPLTSPVDYYNLTSKFGNRKDPFTKRPAWHAGIDLAAWPGTRVRATASGVVTFAGRKGGFGRLVIVNHGCGIETAYGHLRKIYVKKGDSVAHRDSLGEVGSTGRSTGPHVHYEVRIKGKAVDPYQFIEAGRYVYKEQELTVADAK